MAHTRLSRKIIPLQKQVFSNSGVWLENFVNFQMSGFYGIEIWRHSGCLALHFIPLPLHRRYAEAIEILIYLAFWLCYRGG